MQIVTHNGSYHADEVFGCAVLKIIYPDATILRSRDPEIIASADIVLDVGGEYDLNRNRFDHHQIGGAGIRENGIPYASFGLIWKHFGSRVCNDDTQVWQAIDTKLVQPIDAHDTGIDFFTSHYTGLQPYTIGKVFGSVMPTWRERGEDGGDKQLDSTFEKCVGLAIDILRREAVIARDNQMARQIVKGAYDSATDKRIIISEREYLPRQVWYQFITDFPEVLYIVSQRDVDHWNVIAQRVDSNTMAVRKSFPESWAGQRDAELETITGVIGAKFCHLNRFLCTTNSREAATALAQKALDA